MNTLDIHSVKKLTIGATRRLCTGTYVRTIRVDTENSLGAGTFVLTAYAPESSNLSLQIGEACGGTK